MSELKRSKVLFTKLQQTLPDTVPPYPKDSSAPEFLFVQITSKLKEGWYNVDEIYIVPNKLFWGFCGNEPHFAAHVTEKGTPQSGISVEACRILKPGTVLKVPLPEYTLEDLKKKSRTCFYFKNQDR